MYFFSSSFLSNEDNDEKLNERILSFSEQRQRMHTIYEPCRNNVF
jgi:hypothetical protein